MDLLTVSGVSFQEAGQLVLDDISFTQQPGQRIALAGETGAGKSTLLQLVAGLVQPTSGRVLLDGKRVRGPAEQLVPGHPAIAYLSQQSELPQFLRVEQILRYANRQSATTAQTLYEICRIDHLLARRTDQVSGGERQRIALAKLLLAAPRVLLLDEPFSNLDRVHKHVLKSVIRDVGERLSITCLLVSHDPSDTLSWADTILVLQHGRLVQQGTPAQLYQQPRNEYVAALFGEYNLLRGMALTTLADRLGLPSRGSTLLVRPESFRLVSSAAEGVAAVVRQVLYFGAYYEVRVSLADTLLTIKTTHTTVNPGHTVYLSLSPEDAWYGEVVRW